MCHCCFVLFFWPGSVRTFYLELNTTYDVIRHYSNTDHFLMQDTRTANPALGIGQEERFFNRLEDDVSRIVQQEKRREQYANCQGQEVNTSTEHEPVSGQSQMHINKKIQAVFISSRVLK